MSNKEYYTLRRYAKKYTSDPDDQNDLVLLAWQESVRLGERASMPILVNFLKLGARENLRSIVGAKAGGKSIRDAWHQKPVSLNKSIDAEGHTLIDFMASCAEDPFGLCLVNEFENALDEAEAAVAGEIVAGYSQQESLARLGVGYGQFRRLKQVVRTKAVEHLR